MEKNVKEKEINLIDMFWGVCLKWRQIFVCAIIFAVLAGCMSYLLSVQAAKKAAEPVEKISLEDIELEESSQKNVAAYLEYVEIFEDQLEYNENSPLMRLDANGFYRNVISYYVDNYFTVEYPLISKTNNIHAMLEAYRGELRSEKFLGKVEELSGGSEEMSPYCMEMIDCNNSFGQNITGNNSAVGILTISVYAEDEETCRELANLVKETIESKKADVIGKIGNHQLSLIEDVCDYSSDIELLKYQKDNIDKSVAFSNTAREVKNKLTEEELTYIKVYEQEQAEIEDGVKPEEERVIPEVTISKKIVVVGFLGGIALAVCVIAIMYLFNCKLRLEDDFEMIYGVKLLGNVIVESKKKKKIFGFIDDFLIRMRHLNKHYFAEEEAISMVAAAIKIKSNKLGLSKVFVTGAMM